MPAPAVVVVEVALAAQLWMGRGSDPRVPRPRRPPQRRGALWRRKARALVQPRGGGGVELSPVNRAINFHSAWRRPLLGHSGCWKPNHTMPGDLSTSMWVITDNSTFPQYYSHVWWRIGVSRKLSLGNYCTVGKILGEFAKKTKWSVLHQQWCLSSLFTQWSNK